MGRALNSVHKIVKESENLAKNGFDVMFLAKIPGDDNSTATLMFGANTEELDAYLCARRIMRDVKKQFDTIGLSLDYKISRAEGGEE